MSKKHGARPGEITLTEAKKLIPGLKPYRAKKIFERMEHNGTARIGRRAKPPCGACCYVDEIVWKLTLSAREVSKEPIIPKRTIKKPPVESELHEEFEKSEVPLLESGIRTDGHKTEAAKHIPDKQESDNWDELFKKRANDPEEEQSEQPAAPVALAPEDQYEYDELLDIISDFEVVERKPGAAKAGCKSAVRIMKRRGISNAIVDWCILGGAAGTLLFAAFVRKGGGDRTDEDGEDDSDKADIKDSALAQESRNIRLNKSPESRALSDDISTTSDEHAAGSWFNGM